MRGRTIFIVILCLSKAVSLRKTNVKIVYRLNQNSYADFFKIKNRLNLLYWNKILFARFKSCVFMIFYCNLTKITAKSTIRHHITRIDLTFANTCPVFTTIMIVFAWLIWSLFPGSTNNLTVTTRRSRSNASVDPSLANSTAVSTVLQHISWIRVALTMMCPCNTVNLMILAWMLWWCGWWPSCHMFSNPHVQEYQNTREFHFCKNFLNFQSFECRPRVKIIGTVGKFT